MAKSKRKVMVLQLQTFDRNLLQIVVGIPLLPIEFKCRRDLSLDFVHPFAIERPMTWQESRYYSFPADRILLSALVSSSSSSLALAFGCGRDRVCRKNRGASKVFPICIEELGQLCDEIVGRRGSP